jgi:hypothetical protein
LQRHWNTGQFSVNWVRTFSRGCWTYIKVHLMKSLTWHLSFKRPQQIISGTYKNWSGEKRGDERREKRWWEMKGEELVWCDDVMRKEMSKGEKRCDMMRRDEDGREDRRWDEIRLLDPAGTKIKQERGWGMEDANARKEKKRYDVYFSLIALFT